MRQHPRRSQGPKGVWTAQGRTLGHFGIGLPGPGRQRELRSLLGIPELALKRSDSDTLVVSPYAVFLAAAIDPAGALKNLRQMEEFGWTGRYGFYEAVDYTGAGARPVRSWMAHHVGMSLLATCNLLFDRPFQKYFHAEPHVMATELLLHERIPAGLQVEKEEPVSPKLATISAAA